MIDVDWIYREFLCELSMKNDTEEGDIINLIIDQIEFCNLILLNKTDLLSKSALNKVKTAIREIQSDAEMIPCINSIVDTKKSCTEKLLITMQFLLLLPFNVL